MVVGTSGRDGKKKSYRLLLTDDTTEAKYDCELDSSSLREKAETEGAEEKTKTRDRDSVIVIRVGFIW